MNDLEEGVAGVVATVIISIWFILLISIFGYFIK